MDDDDVDTWVVGWVFEIKVFAFLPLGFGDRSIDWLKGSCKADKSGVDRGVEGWWIWRWCGIAIPLPIDVVAVLLLSLLSLSFVSIDSRNIFDGVVDWCKKS